VRGGVPQLWGVFGVGQGSGVHPPAGHPYGATRLRLIWHKRRWRSKERLCERASFTESLPAVRTRSRLTTRLRAELGWAVAEQQRCVSEAAAHYGASWPIVHAAFAEHVRVPLAAPLPPVKVLGIDETRRGKPIWAQDPDTKRWVLVCDRWHTGFVDAAGTVGLLAQVEGRTSAATSAWLNAQPAPWRAGITHVTIDLSASYAKAVRVALPDAVLVADRFHLVALANGMLTQVRQRVIRETHDRRGRKTDPAWAARRRLLTGYERLRPETFAKMWNSLIDTGDEGVQILQAYVVKSSERCWRWPGPTPNGTSSAPAWTASTNTPPRPRHPRRTAWPPRSKRGGRRLKQAF
jgi:transposase